MWKGQLAFLADNQFYLTREKNGMKEPHYSTVVHISISDVLALLKLSSKIQEYFSI